MADDLIADAAAQVFVRAATPEAVRAILAGGSPAALWDAVEESGLLDGLVTEARGGAGLTLADMLPVLLISGRHAAPVPVGETMLVRAALGGDAPHGRIAIAGRGAVQGRGVRCEQVAHGRDADWVLAALDGAWVLLPAEGGERRASPGGSAADADIDWPSRPDGRTAVSAATDWRAAGALVTAARMVGAMTRVLDDSVRYASDRTQFGRPIGKFQAIQHQLAVMAEQVEAAASAVRLGCVAPPGPALVDPLRAAAAKLRAGQAAAAVSAIGHAVHGAIGVTAEFDLHLFTGLLQRGQLAFGGETYWAGVIGRAVLADGDAGALDFVRRRLGTGESMGSNA